MLLLLLNCVFLPCLSKSNIHCACNNALGEVQHVTPTNHLCINFQSNNNNEQILGYLALLLRGDYYNMLCLCSKQHNES